MRWHDRLLGGILTLVFLLFALTASVLRVGLDPSFYAARLSRGAGIGEADVLRVAHGLPTYLAGDTAALEMTMPVYGVEQAAFSPDELTHMLDVQGLFFLTRLLMWVGLGGTVLILLILVLSRKRRNWRALAQGGLAVPGVLAVLLGLLAAWAVMDFNGAFFAFHQAFFTNDLWLMDPATDLMIRLMPEQLFRDAAFQVVLVFGSAMAIWCGGLLALRFKNRRKPHARG